MPRRERRLWAWYWVLRRRDGITVPGRAWLPRPRPIGRGWVFSRRLRSTGAEIVDSRGRRWTGYASAWGDRPHQERSCSQIGKPRRWNTPQRKRGRRRRHFVQLSRRRSTPHLHHQGRLYHSGHARKLRGQIPGHVEPRSRHNTTISLRHCYVVVNN